MVSFSQPSIWPEKMGSYDRAVYANIARANDGAEPVSYTHLRKRGKEVKCRLIHIHAWDMGY